MDAPSKKIPVTLMLDFGRHEKLKAASRSTRISMSELMRMSVDLLMLKIRNPESPDAAALASLTRCREID